MPELPPRRASPAPRLPWERISTVLLDLDGTLLDLEFDYRFWLDLVPAVYAQSRCLTLEAARAEVIRRFQAREGSLAWYCIDHWSRELGLDIESLKRAESHRVAWLPGARDFLQRVRAAGKRLVLLTNSHPRVLRIKDDRTGVTGYLDAVISSHDLGMPKEDPRFWEAVRTIEPFAPATSLFVDDTPAVLKAALAAGVRWVFGVRYPSTARSVRAPRVDEAVTWVDSVSDLVPDGL